MFALTIACAIALAIRQQCFADDRFAYDRFVAAVQTSGGKCSSLHFPARSSRESRQRQGRPGLKVHTDLRGLRSLPWETAPFVYGIYVVEKNDDEADPINDDDVRRAITASGSPPTVIEVEGARAAVTPAFFEILGETRAVTRFGYKHEYNAAVAPDTIDKRLAALKNCPDLKSLKLCYAVCDDDAFAALGAFTALKSLELPFTNIEARHLPAIATLPKLESLGLSSCERLTTLTGLAEAKKLKSLALVSTPICDESAALLRDLPSLAHLGIHGTKISDAGLAELLESRSLQRITSSFMLESDAWVKDLSFSDRPFDLGVMRVSAGVREALLAKRPRLTISEMSPSTPRTLPPERDPRRSRR